MTGARPLRFSVVIGVRDGEDFVGDAIQSVLAQTRPAAETIVVDDGSTDATASIVASFGDPVTLVVQPARGISAARNRGVATATGDVVAFLDADDLWEPDKLARQAALLEAEPELDAVFAFVVEFGDSAFRRAVTGENRLGFIPSAFAIRRTAFDGLGGFDTSLIVGEWIDFWARATDRGIRSAVVPEVLVRRRLHASNHGRLALRARGELAFALKESINRKRGSSGAGP